VAWRHVPTPLRWMLQERKGRRACTDKPIPKRHPRGMTPRWFESWLRGRREGVISRLAASAHRGGSTFIGLWWTGQYGRMWGRNLYLARSVLSMDVLRGQYGVARKTGTPRKRLTCQEPRRRGWEARAVSGPQQTRLVGREEPTPLSTHGVWAVRRRAVVRMGEDPWVD